MPERKTSVAFKLTSQLSPHNWSPTGIFKCGTIWSIFKIASFGRSRGGASDIGKPEIVTFTTQLLEHFSFCSSSSARVRPEEGMVDNHDRMAMFGEIDTVRKHTRILVVLSFTIGRVRKSSLEAPECLDTRTRCSMAKAAISIISRRGRVGLKGRSSAVPQPV
jgi:hypothetical protein